MGSFKEKNVRKLKFNRYSFNFTPAKQNSEMLFHDDENEEKKHVFSV